MFCHPWGEISKYLFLKMHIISSKRRILKASLICTFVFTKNLEQFSLAYERLDGEEVSSAQPVEDAPHQLIEQEQDVEGQQDQRQLSNHL